MELNEISRPKKRLGKVHVQLLAIFAVIVAVAAVLLYQRQDQKTGERFTPKKLFPKLNLDQVSEVDIAAGTQKFSIKKSGEDTWGLTARENYPVDSEKLRQLIFSVGELEAADKMTADPQKYERLGITDESNKAHIRLLDGQGTELASVFVGKDKEGSPSGPGGFAPTEGQYVRVANDPAVYKINEALRVTSEPPEWLSKDLVKIDEKNLEQVKVDSTATTQSFTLARVGAEPFKLLNPMPAGFKENTGTVGTVTRGLNNLTLTDVHREGNPAIKGLDFNTTYTAIQKNGLIYVAGLAKKGETHYATVQARYEKAFDFSLSDEKTSDSQVAKSLELADTTLKKFNPAHHGWVYEVQGYLYTNLAKNFSDMIQLIPTPTPTPTPTPAEGVGPPVPTPPAGAPPAGAAAKAPGAEKKPATPPAKKAAAPPGAPAAQKATPPPAPAKDAKPPDPVPAKK